MNKQQPESFEMAMDELEKIVAELSGGNLALEKSLESFKRGIELSQFCQKTLQDAEKTIAELKIEQMSSNESETMKHD